MHRRVRQESPVLLGRAGVALSGLTVGFDTLGGKRECDRRICSFSQEGGTKVFLTSLDSGDSGPPG